MPRQGRHDVISAFWTLFDEYKDRKERKPAFMIHGSAGCGKTYLLRELALKKPEDVEGRDVDNVKFIPISFYTRTFITETEKAKFPRKNPGPFFMIPRIIHSAFLRNAVDFQKFLFYFFEKFRVDDMADMVTEMKELLEDKFPGMEIVLLIDEISKLERISEIKTISESVRASFCSLPDTSNNNNDPKKGTISVCVFSSLSIVKLGDQGVFTTYSERPILPLGCLSMFTFHECKAIIEHFFRTAGVIVLNKNDEKVPASTEQKLLYEAFERIYILSGGHPRTLDTILFALTMVLSKRKMSQIPNPTLPELLKVILSDAFRDSIKINATDYYCVRSVFMADVVQFGDNIPGLGNVTFDEAVKSGHLIGSNKYIMYTPYLPVINLYRWAQLCEPFQFQEVPFKIIRMLEIGMKFNPTDFEQFCYNRELVLSHFRSSMTKYECISLAELYYKGMQLNGKETLAIKVNASEKLEIKNYDNLSEIPEHWRGIAVPLNPQNAGFDYFIRYSMAASSDYIDVYFQIRYSGATSTKKINNTEVTECLGHCSVASKGKPFVFIMYGWRETRNNLTVPPNCVIYDRQRLEWEFGPTLAHFISTLELSQTRFGSSASTRVEGVE